MRVAVIPARGGSKRIPLKNIRPFCDRPIISYSIDSAIKSGCFDRVIVSTDDSRVAACAQECGAEAPFVRPAELSGDYVGTAEVVRHCIDWLETEGARPDKVCCIYATAPFTSPQDLRDGLNILDGNELDFVIPVARFPFPIQRALRMGSDGYLRMFEPNQYETRSQDLAPAYHDAGQFYWATRDAWMTDSNPYRMRAAPLILPRYKVQDIDDLEDWENAELLYQLMTKKESLI